MTKILVAFYTTYGTNQRIAQHAADAAKSSGADVRLVRFRETAPEDVVNGQDAWKAQLVKMRDIPEITHDDMVWADGYFFAIPTRYGSTPSQVQAFFDTLGPLWMEGKLANKSVTATCTAGNAQGGQTATVLGLYTSTMHWGAVIVAPGFTDPAISEAGGNPYGYAGVANAFDEKGKAAVSVQAKRLVTMTDKLA